MINFTLMRFQQIFYNNRNFMFCLNAEIHYFSCYKFFFHVYFVKNLFEFLNNNFHKKNKGQ